MTAVLDPLPPREAMAALARRGARLDPTFAWQDAWEADHAAMFTVAKSAGFDILQDIHDAVAAALAQGRTFTDFERGLTPILQAKGWWGRKTVTDPATGERREAQLGSARRLRTIFDTNMRVSYAAGHWANFERSKAARPFLRYVAILDERTRPAHRARHNLVLPVDHPYWNAWAPPCGWNCRCTLQNLSQRDIDRLVAEGEQLAFAPPADTWRDYQNRRTGEVTRVPDGIDPGWAYNPGKAGWRALSGYVSQPPPQRRPSGANIRATDLSELSEETVHLVLGLDGPDEAAALLRDMVRDVPGPIDMKLYTAFGDLKAAFRGSDWYAFRTFSRRRGSLRVEHDYFYVDPAKQGGGIGSTVLENSMEVYEQLGVERILVHADIDVGGYAWAKFGFFPNENSWDDLRDEIASRLPQISSPDKRAAIAALLDDDDPTAVWAIADSRDGKTLLLHTDWIGELRLDDPLAMDRFRRYVRRSRSKL